MPESFVEEAAALNVGRRRWSRRMLWGPMSASPPARSRALPVRSPSHAPVRPPGPHVDDRPGRLDPRRPGLFRFSGVRCGECRGAAGQLGPAAALLAGYRVGLGRADPGHSPAHPDRHVGARQPRPQRRDVRPCWGRLLSGVRDARMGCGYGDGDEDRTILVGSLLRMPGYPSARLPRHRDPGPHCALLRPLSHPAHARIGTRGQAGAHPPPGAQDAAAAALSVQYPERGGGAGSHRTRCRRSDDHPSRPTPAPLAGQRRPSGRPAAPGDRLSQGLPGHRASSLSGPASDRMGSRSGDPRGGGPHAAVATGAGECHPAWRHAAGRPGAHRYRLAPRGRRPGARDSRQRYRPPEGGVQREGVGLRNIRERVEQLYGSGAVFRLAPALGGGTVAMLRLPFTPCERALRRRCPLGQPSRREIAG